MQTGCSLFVDYFYVYPILPKQYKLTSVRSNHIYHRTLAVRSRSVVPPGLLLVHGVLKRLHQPFLKYVMF